MVKKNKKQYNIERGFISKLVESKDMKLLKDVQIKPSFFTGDNKRIFLYIQESFKDTGEVPTPRVLSQKFPSYELETHLVEGDTIVGTDETLVYWCKEVRVKAKHNKMAEVLEEVAEKLDDSATEEAYSLMKKGVWQIEGEIVETSSVDITKNTEDRKEAYLKRKMNKGMIGIPTGISHLDYILKGFANETLTTVIAQTGVGKAITLDTPILTPSGFIPMREIKVGSIVYDENGEEAEVTHIYPQGRKQIYRVLFEDGTHVDCCKDHLWKFKTSDDVIRNNEWRTETTERLMQRPLKRGRAYNLCIPIAKAVQFSEKEFPLDPYVLGALLGDGGFTTDRISFTNPDGSLVHKLNDKLKHLGEFKRHKGNDIQYLFKSNDPRCNKLYRTIKELGLIKQGSLSKFIPTEYLMGSEKQRLELLRGLIDTDGGVNSKGKVSYYTSSDSLKNDVMSLIRSLGFRCTSSSYKREDKKNIEHVVRISSDLGVFFTSEKHVDKYTNRIVPNRVNHYNNLKIVDIQVLPEFEEMQCITVNSPEHTFICGDYIVTHNTWLLVLFACYAQLNGYKVCLFITEMSTDIMQDRCEAMLYGMMYGNFNYNNFKSGALDTITENNYFEFLEEDLPKLEPMILETATGVSSIVSVIEREKPDLVMIDSAYLMEDEQGAKDDWARITHITRDLKKCAKQWHKPIVINTQADQNTSKKTGPGLGDIKYSQAIGQDSDNVLALFRDEIMINDNEMGVRVLKQREGILGKVVINWNFNNMNFKSIYSESDAPDVADNSSPDEAEDNHNKAIIGVK